MPEELVFTVVGEKAQPATPITLSEAGLRERAHLQEWVLSHPSILGADVLVITSEFDRWESRGGVEKDRLDVLGLASDGHLVVAELKKDMAPDTVEMQAIKYAAMASRFTADVLADAYAKFRRAHHEESLTSDEALEALSAHVELGLTDEALRAPRIVLVAGGFPANVTASAVWLSEMGLDITLVRIQAYKTAQEVVVTVSQHYPPPEVEDFIVIPKPARATTPRLPVIEWKAEDLRLLATEVNNETIKTTMDLCAASPDTWIAASTIRSVTGKEPASQRGEFGGFGITLKTRFKRSNTPYDFQWAAGDAKEYSYKLSPELAELWRAATRGDEPGTLATSNSKSETMLASASSDVK